MTGFARVNNTIKIGENDYSWYWELKSVNGKSLEIKSKVPFWLDAICTTLKNQASEFVSRGNLYACLDISTQNQEPKIKINEQLLQQLANQATILYQQNPNLWQKPNPAELLNVRGVVELEDSQLNDEQMSILQTAILSSFNDCVKSLAKDRQAEGNKIVAVLSAIIDKISDIIPKIEIIADKLPLQLKEKLIQQIASLLEPSNQITEERLAQEVVLLVNRTDIKEEIDRLKAHINTAQELLNSNEAIGRRLDFLCQELNRETNTICSKSAEIELTNYGMQLKALIEQFREQVQNIE